MANSKDRFQVWLSPEALVFDRFLSWDFDVGISANRGSGAQSPSRTSLQSRPGAETHPWRGADSSAIFSMPPITQTMSLFGTMAWFCQPQGSPGRSTVHFVYAGSSKSPGPGTVIKYGSYVFYAKLGVESFFAHGHELHVTDNGGHVLVVPLPSASRAGPWRLAL